MISNARIISLKTQAGADGLGEPQLGEELIKAHLSVELIAPKSYRVDRDRARDIRNDAMLWVNRSTFDVIGHTPCVGDRLIIQTVGLRSTETAYDATDINPRGNGSVIEITLAVRDDNAEDA